VPGVDSGRRQWTPGDWRGLVTDNTSKLFAAIPMWHKRFYIPATRIQIPPPLPIFKGLGA